MPHELQEIESEFIGMEKSECRNCGSDLFNAGTDVVNGWRQFVVRCSSCNLIHVCASRHDIDSPEWEDEE